MPGWAYKPPKPANKPGNQKHAEFQAQMRPSQNCPEKQKLTVYCAEGGFGKADESAT